VHKKPGPVARWFAHTKEAITGDEVVERLKKIERSLELQYISKPQAEVTHATATAAAQLIVALQQTPQAAIQIGNLLILKVRRSGEPSLIVRSLSERELALIDADPEILGAPGQLLRLLTEPLESQALVSESTTKPQL